MSPKTGDNKGRELQARRPNSSHKEGPDTPQSAFSRLEPKTTHTTAEGPAETPEIHTQEKGSSDFFEKKRLSLSENDTDSPTAEAAPELPERFDELPIELISLTDRFINSLSAKIYTTPPSADKLSDLFQEFYVRAGSHIKTHVSTLASRLNREDSQSSIQTQGKSNKASQKSKGATPPVDTPAEQQMLTATEVAEKRKARKLLQFKVLALEEAVERRACEAIYVKIWRHRSTIDDIRDEKLRSKTAALLVMGIKLRDLGVDTKDAPEPKEWLSSACRCLMQMDEVKHPRGKVQHLLAAHKSIVDELTKVLPSSSSADEILPTLIYTIILLPSEGINLISNLNFIQRFRASSKIDGETAYCLTNLEAAIDFLENVDLTSLDLEDGRIVSEVQPLEIIPPVSITNGSVDTTISDDVATKIQAKSVPSVSTPSTQKRLSNIFEPPARALGAANDIVRNTADQGLKNISSTLDNSFTFLFGRLKEVQIKQQGNGAEDGSTASPVLPKTLDDARRLVQSDSKSPPNEKESENTDAAKVDVLGSSKPITPRVRLDDRLAELVGGRRRATSIQSQVSTSSVETKASSSMVDGFGSVRNLGNSLNPLSHIPSMIRGLGRNTAEPSTTITAATVAKERSILSSIERASTTRTVSEPVSSLAKLRNEPALQKFLDVDDASQLRVGDIAELLADYKRLAGILNSSEGV